MVGTHWLWVTWYRSISASASIGSKRSMHTTVPPSACTPVLNPNGAEWYNGAGDRYTESALNPNSPAITPAASRFGSSMPAPDSGRLMPFGRPVVPDEYSIVSPRGCCANGLGRDCAATVSS